MRKILAVIILCLFITGIAYATQLVEIQPLTYSISTQTVSVTTSATKLPSTALAGRKYVSIQNVGTITVYIGSSTVTADTASTGGKQLLPYATITRDYDESVDVYGIVATGTCNVIVEEGK